MADQGLRFGNFLNNQPTLNWNKLPASGFGGGAFQSLLQKPVGATQDWRSTPEGYMGQLNALRTKFPKATDADIKEAMSRGPVQDDVNTSLGAILQQAAYNQSPEGMRQQLEMGKEMAREQAKETLKYQTLANLPGQIERAFAADKYYEGMSRIPEIYRSTFASVPSMNIQAPGYSAPQMRYFN
jgi:hypothetical protein